MRPQHHASQPQTAEADGVYSLSKRSLLRTALGFSLLGLGGIRAARAVGIEDFYKINIKPEVFLAEVFGGAVPPPQVVSAGGTPGGLMKPLESRMRYWRANGRTAWIFDEIGKTGYQPTTCGFVVKDGAIEQARVLIYRESRGEQIGEPSFLKQLVGARSNGGAIDKRVDNISGATYSVQLMQRMAAAALALDKMAG